MTTKVNNTVDVFNIDRGRLSAPVRNVSASAVPFAVTFDTRGRPAVGNAGNSSVRSYRLTTDGTLSTISAGVEDGQAALCWLVAAGGTLFGGNAGSSTISAFGATSTATWR